MTSVSPSWFNRWLYVWRETVDPDGAGGHYTEYMNHGRQRVKVDQSSAEERAIAQQDGAVHTHNIYTFTFGDLRRGDRLAEEGVDPNQLEPGEEVYRVLMTTHPSTPIYLKAQAERIQSATLAAGSSS